MTVGATTSRANESHNVGVVLKDEHFLIRSAGGIISGRSDLDNGTGFQVWELDFKGKNVIGCV